MIDHDTTTTFRSYPLVFGQWREGANRNIHVLRDAHGRQLEFVNVNNSAVESRTGTDMIYYYVPTNCWWTTGSVANLTGSSKSRRLAVPLPSPATGA